MLIRTEVSVLNLCRQAGIMVTRYPLVYFAYEDPL